MATIDFSYTINLTDDFINTFFKAVAGRKFERLELILLNDCSNDNLTADSLTLLASIVSKKVVEIRMSGFDLFVLLKLYSKSQL